MSVKITISYERPEELQKYLDRHRSEVKCYKLPKDQKGRYKKAYVVLREEQE